MRIRVGFVLAVVLALGMSPAPADASAQYLEAGAASQAAQRLGRSIVDRDPKLQVFSIFACSRTGANSFFCLIEASGETKHQRLECDLAVSVRLSGEKPTTKLQHRGCHSVHLYYLTRQRAEQALTAAFLRLHGPTLPWEAAGVNILQRIGGATFEALGESIKESSADVIEVCSMKMTAQLVGPQTISIQADQPTCKQSFSVPG